MFHQTSSKPPANAGGHGLQNQFLTISTNESQPVRFSKAWLIMSTRSAVMCPLSITSLPPRWLSGEVDLDSGSVPQGGIELSNQRFGRVTSEVTLNTEMLIKS